MTFQRQTFIQRRQLHGVIGGACVEGYLAVVFALYGDVVCGIATALICGVCIGIVLSEWKHFA